jgi:hypothetical protein
MARIVYLILFAALLGAPAGTVFAEDEPSEAPESEVAGDNSEGPASAEEEEGLPATFVGDYPVRFARRPLVLNEGMVRADGRLTVGGGGVLGPGTFSALDIGGAVSPIENLELGLSTELTGAVPAPGGISLITVIFSPQASYGDIPVYGRYQFLENETALLAVDLVLVLPANTDFTMTASLPLRIVELFDLMTMDSAFSIRYRNGDKYAALPGVTNPSKNTADFTFSGGAAVNITNNGYLEIGGGVGIVNVGGGDGANNVWEIPFFIGGGYTYEGKVLADIFAQFGFQPLMTANAPPGRDTFNVGDDWYITIGATVHTKPLFGKNKQ